MQLNKSHTSEIDCHGKEEECSVPPQKLTCESFHLTQCDEAETTVSHCPAAEYKVHLQQEWNSLCSWHEIQCSLLWRFISTGREKHTFFQGRELAGRRTLAWLLGWSTAVAPGLVCAQAPMHDWHRAHLGSSTEAWLDTSANSWHFSDPWKREEREEILNCTNIYLTLISAKQGREKQLEINLEVAISLLSNLYLVRLIYRYGRKWISESNKMNTLFRESS